MVISEDCLICEEYMRKMNGRRVFVVYMYLSTVELRCKLQGKLHRVTWPLKVILHCSRFARVGEATDFNLVKNQSRGHAKIVKCSSTSKRVRAHKS